MKKSQRARQAGATLLESLAFLGIASIIVVGAISMFRAAQSSAQAKDLIGQINGIRSSTKTLYASQSYGRTDFSRESLPSPAGGGRNGPAGTLGSSLISAASIPDTLSVSGGEIRNSFGGNVFISGGFNADGESFWIEYQNVPQEVCLKVAPQIGGSWMGLKINSNSFVDTDSQTFPVATADAQCTPGTSNTMVFRSR